MTTLTMPAATLSAAWPLSLSFGPDGRVLSAGRALERIAPNARDRATVELFQLVHPEGDATAEELLARSGRRLRLRLRGRDGDVPLAGAVHPLCEGQAMLLLSFGTGVAEAVRRHDLDARDFSAIDPTFELLFVLEARAAIMAEMRRLDARLEDARRAAEMRARTDSLTGLPNRRVLDHTLHRLAAAPSPRFGVMQVDLDHFKAVNDTMGHAAGDAVLAHAAEILADEVRDGDLVTRVGGDEFVIVLPDCDDIDLLVGIGERIVARLQRPIPFEGAQCRISGSVGIALSTAYATLRLDRLLADADSALYASKAAGRARVTVAQEGAAPP